MLRVVLINGKASSNEVDENEGKQTKVGVKQQRMRVEYVPNRGDEFRLNKCNRST